MIDPTIPITEATLAIVDVETTGLRPESGDRVVEIGIVRCEGLHVVDELQQLVNPQRPIGSGAMAVHGITDEEVRHAPLFAEIADDVLALLDGAVFVGHNVSFDLGFVAAELYQARRALPRLLSLDTLQLARQYYRCSSYALSSLARTFRIDYVGSAHRAMADVLVTKGLLEMIIRDQMPRGVRTVEDFMRGQRGWHREDAVAPDKLPQPIQQALENDLFLWLRYRAEGGAVTERVVRPMRVFQRTRGLFLEAFCYLRQGRRTFRLDRIVKAEAVERFE